MAVAARGYVHVDLNESDAALVRGVVAHDPDCEVALYRRYLRLARFWIQGWFKRADWTCDMADQAVSHLFEVIHKFDPTRGSFFSWAHRVVQVEALCFYNKMRIGREDACADEVLAEALPALLSPPDEYLASRVLEEVDNLDLEHREVVDGRFFLDRTDRENAERLNIPVRRANYRLQQAMNRLRLRLSDVPTTSIRLERRRTPYYLMKTDDMKDDDREALPGGEDGD